MRAPYKRAVRNFRAAQTHRARCHALQGMSITQKLVAMTLAKQGGTVEAAATTVLADLDYSVSRICFQGRPAPGPPAGPPGAAP